MTSHDEQRFPSRQHMIYMFHYKIYMKLKECRFIWKPAKVGLGELNLTTDPGVKYTFQCVTMAVKYREGCLLKRMMIIY